MPRYFFDIEADDRMLRDVQGSLLPNREAARAAAEAAAREFISGRSRGGENVGQETLIVRDEEGACVLSVVCAALIERVG